MRRRLFLSCRKLSAGNCPAIKAVKTRIFCRSLLMASLTLFGNDTSTSLQSDSDKRSEASRRFHHATYLFFSSEEHRDVSPHLVSYFSSDFCRSVRSATFQSLVVTLVSSMQAEIRVQLACRPG